MPNEPPDSVFRDKVGITAYPARDKGGCIWAYLGPADRQPNVLTAYPSQSTLAMKPNVTRIEYAPIASPSFCRNHLPTAARLTTESAL